MPDARQVVAWTLAIGAVAFLAASLTGRGVGPWGLGWMSHMGWSYAVLAVAIVVVLAFAEPGKRRA